MNKMYRAMIDDREGFVRTADAATADDAVAALRSLIADYYIRDGADDDECTAAALCDADAAIAEFDVDVVPITADDMPADDDERARLNRAIAALTMRDVLMHSGDTHESRIDCDHSGDVYTHR